MHSQTQAVTGFGRALVGAVAYSEELKAEMASNLDTSKTTMFTKLGVRAPVNWLMCFIV